MHFSHTRQLFMKRDGEYKSAQCGIGMELYFITAKDQRLITFSCLTAQRVWMMVRPDAHVCE